MRQDYTKGKSSNNCACVEYFKDDHFKIRLCPPVSPRKIRRRNNLSSFSSRSKELVLNPALLNVDYTKWQIYLVLLEVSTVSHDAIVMHLKSPVKFVWVSALKLLCLLSRVLVD